MGNSRKKPANCSGSDGRRIEIRTLKICLFLKYPAIMYAVLMGRSRSFFSGAFSRRRYWHWPCCPIRRQCPAIVLGLGITKPAMRRARRPPRGIRVTEIKPCKQTDAFEIEAQRFKERYP
jgi:hypothetical protein